MKMKTELCSLYLHMQLLSFVINNYLLVALQNLTLIFSFLQLSRSTYY